jgi:hypothetical protein
MNPSALVVALLAASLSLTQLPLIAFGRTDAVADHFVDGDQFQSLPFSVGGSISHAFFRHTSVTFDFTAMRLVLGS